MQRAGASARLVVLAHELVHGAQRAGVEAANAGRFNVILMEPVIVVP